jgi:hypothetical protein
VERFRLSLEQAAEVEAVVLVKDSVVIMLLVMQLLTVCKL